MNDGSTRHSDHLEKVGESIFQISTVDFMAVEKAIKSLGNEWEGPAAEEIIKNYYELKKSYTEQFGNKIKEYSKHISTVAAKAKETEDKNKQSGEGINQDIVTPSSSVRSNKNIYPPFDNDLSIHPIINRQDGNKNEDIIKKPEYYDRDGNLIDHNDISFNYGQIQTMPGIVSERGTVRYITQTCNKPQTVPGIKTYQTKKKDTYNPYYFDSYWIAGTTHYSPKSECNTACISMAYSYLGLDYTPADLFQMWNGKKKNENNGATIPGRVPESKNSKIKAPVGIKHVNGNNKSFTEMFNDYKKSAEAGEYEYSPIIIQIRDKHKIYNNAGKQTGVYSHYVMVVDKVDGKENEYLIVDPYSYNKEQITKTVTIIDHGNSYTVSSDAYQNDITHVNGSDNIKQYYRSKDNNICFKQMYE